MWSIIINYIICGHNQLNLIVDKYLVIFTLNCCKFLIYIYIYINNKLFNNFGNLQKKN